MADVKSLVRQAAKQKRIEHPLAKYSSTGQLSCVLCDFPVKSDALWHTHLLSKRHKDAFQAAEDKKRRETSKRVAEEQSSETKKPKISSTSRPPIDGKGPENEMAQKLPEGFFDDVKKEAKIRKVDPREAVEEEFAKFQKELEVEAEAADELLEADAVEEMEDRAVEEEVEQKEAESRVAQLKNRFAALKQEKAVGGGRAKAAAEESGEGDEDDDDVDVDGMFGWRAKAL
eukprot:m.65770 g.65770  ORF g.65770 m.65770 type:complete len:230 (+) comp12622_c0_seq1:10-699(+)